MRRYYSPYTFSVILETIIRMKFSNCALENNPNSGDKSNKYNHLRIVSVAAGVDDIVNFQQLTHTRVDKYIFLPQVVDTGTQFFICLIRCFIKELHSNVYAILFSIVLHEYHSSLASCLIFKRYFTCYKSFAFWTAPYNFQ